METSIFSQVDIDADEISHLDEDNLIGHGAHGKVYRITLKKNRMVCEAIRERNAKYEEALERFESVLGTKQEPDEAAVASYNVGCCYSKLNQELSNILMIVAEFLGGLNERVEKGTICIQGVALDFKKRLIKPEAEKYNDVIFDTKSFETKVNFRLLQINNLSLKDKFLLDELKWIQWQGCPLKFIPLDTLPHELAVLDLSNAEKI
ncbi:unnamed protein product [Vicia faba]|uniref:Uncharacterized protein n=1 Tax=Vicia faba TaxID=3906 RepID=A0AAV1BBT2_VICFA|nr:unnamed protein product [Vicia faba]